MKKCPIHLVKWVGSGPVSTSPTCPSPTKTATPTLLLPFHGEKPLSSPIDLSITNTRSRIQLLSLPSPFFRSPPPTCCPSPRPSLLPTLWQSHVTPTPPCNSARHNFPATVRAVVVMVGCRKFARALLQKSPTEIGLFFRKDLAI